MENGQGVTLTPDEAILKAVHDLGETAKNRAKADNERFEEFSKRLKDIEELTAKATKRVDIFSEYDPRAFAFEPNQASFSKLMSSAPNVGGGSAPIHSLVEEMKGANDALYITKCLWHGMTEAKISPKEALPQTTAFKRFEYLKGSFLKALNTDTAGSGAEIVPTGFSSQMMSRVALALRLAANLRSFPMPTDPYKWPFVNARAVAQKVSETTAAANPYALTEAIRAWYGSSPTANTTFETKKMRVLELISRELNDDAIISVMSWLMDELVLAMAEGTEDAFVNGDTDTVTHVDSDVVESSADIKTLLDGFRKYALETASNATTDLGTFNVDNLHAIKSGMGKYGVNPSDLVWLTSAVGLFKFLGLEQVLTLDKLGPNATIKTGQLGEFENSPLLVSAFMRSDLNASGVYDGVTETKTAALCINTLRWLIGRRPGLGIETERLTPTDSFLFVGFDRLDLKQVDTAACNSVGYGYNIG